MLSKNSGITSVATHEVISNRKDGPKRKKKIRVRKEKPKEEFDKPGTQSSEQNVPSPRSEFKPKEPKRQLIEKSDDNDERNRNMAKLAKTGRKGGDKNTEKFDKTNLSPQKQTDFRGEDDSTSGEAKLGEPNDIEQKPQNVKESHENSENFFDQNENFIYGVESDKGRKNLGDAIIVDHEEEEALRETNASYPKTSTKLSDEKEGKDNDSYKHSNTVNDESNSQAQRSATIDERDSEIRDSVYEEIPSETEKTESQKPVNQENHGDYHEDYLEDLEYEAKKDQDEPEDQENHWKNRDQDEQPEDYLEDLEDQLKDHEDQEGHSEDLEDQLKDHEDHQKDLEAQPEDREYHPEDLDDQSKDQEDLLKDMEDHQDQEDHQKFLEEKSDYQEDQLDEQKENLEDRTDRPEDQEYQSEFSQNHLEDNPKEEEKHQSLLTSEVEENSPNEAKPTSKDYEINAQNAKQQTISESQGKMSLPNDVDKEREDSPEQQSQFSNEDSRSGVANKLSEASNKAGSIVSSEKEKAMESVNFDEALPGSHSMSKSLVEQSEDDRDEVAREGTEEELLYDIAYNSPPPQENEYESITSKIQDDQINNSGKGFRSIFSVCAPRTLRNPQLLHTELLCKNMARVPRGLIIMRPLRWGGAKGKDPSFQLLICYQITFYEIHSRRCDAVILPLETPKSKNTCLVLISDHKCSRFNKNKPPRSFCPTMFLLNRHKYIFGRGWLLNFFI